MSTELILPGRGLHLRHREILRVPAWGGLDVPSLADLRELAKKFSDGWLADFLKDGWEAISVMSAPSRAFKLGLPTSQSLSGLVGMPRAPGRGSRPSPIMIVTTFPTAGTTNHPLEDGYGFALFSGVGSGAGSTGGTGAVTGGSGAGGCFLKSLNLEPSGNGSVEVIRGAAGAAGSDGNPTTMTFSNPSLFALVLTANGGTKATTTTGGPGGTASNGDENHTGGSGGNAGGNPGGGGGAAGPDGDGGTGGASGAAGGAGTNNAGGGATGSLGGSTGPGGGGVGHDGGFDGGGSNQVPGQSTSKGGFMPPGASPAVILNGGRSVQHGGAGGGGSGGNSAGAATGTGGIGTAAIMQAAA